MKKKKILFTWLGITDLRASQGNLDDGGVGPIAEAVKTFDFAEVHILSDADESANFAYCEWLENYTEAVIILHPHKLSNPMNFAEIYEAAVKTLKKCAIGDGRTTERKTIPEKSVQHRTSSIDKFKGDREDIELLSFSKEKRKLRPTSNASELHHQIIKSKNLQIVFHISPGTSAMAAIWIILAKTAYPAELLQSSKEEGAKIISIPFDIAADYNPALILGHDDEILRISQGLPPEAPEFKAIIYKCKAMQEAVTKARIVALHNIPVLINGESGTGKELFARAIHASSPRKSGPFIEVNCGAVPENLFESEFFGHVKGAFTGAHKERKGYIESADGGTLFLDEIGELPLYAQVKLLRVIQEGSVTRVGSTEPVKVDVRIICATHKNLMNEVAGGNFREDLFHRLAIGVFKLPALRERRGDLNILIDHFLDEINCEFRRIHGSEWQDRILSANARNVLSRHKWPGNIRELRNTLTRIILWTPNATIRSKAVSDAIFADSDSSNGIRIDFDDSKDFDLQDLLGSTAVKYIETALQKTEGNKCKAAELLGFANYQTMDNWIKKYRKN